MLIVKFGKNRVIIAIAVISLLSLISLALAPYEYECYWIEPPYENQNTYPEDGTEKWMYTDPEDPSFYRIFADADKELGMARLEAYEIGNDFPPVYAWAEFNTNPPPGNSPQVIGEREGDMFQCGADFYTDGYLIGPEPNAESMVSFTIYVYYWDPFEGWKCMDKKICQFSSWDHGGEFREWIQVMTSWYYLEPNVKYSMAIKVKVGAYTTVSSTQNICAWADFRSNDYYIYVRDMWIDVLRWKP